MITTFKKLFPKGLAWRFPSGYISDLAEALTIEPERIKEFLKGVVTESNPGTAIDTQQEWYEQYGIPYDSTKTLKDKQAETLERYVALGDQDIVYIQGQVEKAGFDQVTIYENLGPIPEATNECGPAECGIAECWDVPGYVADPTYWIFYYLVKGIVDTDEETLRLTALLERIAPAHLVPFYDIDASDNVCGPAECGPAFCDG